MQTRSSVPTNGLIEQKRLENHLYSLVSYSQDKTSTAINTIGGDKPGMTHLDKPTRDKKRNAKKITRAAHFTSSCSIHINRKYFRMSLLEQTKPAMQNAARRK